MYMSKTIRINEKAHENLREYKEKHGLSSFNEAVEKALHEAEGIIDETGLICSTRDVLGGQPRIKGTRIGLLNIHQWHFEEGMDAEQISESYDVETEGVEAAIQYIEDNSEEIEQIKKEQEISEKASRERAKERMRELKNEDMSR